MRRRALTLVRIAVGIAVSAGLGWLAARGLDWGLVAESFGGVSLPLVLLAVVVFMVASYLRAARWKVLFVNDEVSTNRLFIIQNVGIGLNNVMPVRIASESPSSPSCPSKTASARRSRSPLSEWSVFWTSWPAR